MPGIAWAAIAVWGALTGSSLLGPPPIWAGHDSRVNKSNYRPEPVEYRTWTSSPRRDKPHTCTFTMFAMVSRERLMRLRINGQEQLVDWGWSWDVEVPEGMHGDGLVVEYIDPVTRVVAATHEVAETCWPKEMMP